LQAGCVSLPSAGLAGIENCTGCGRPLIGTVAPLSAESNRSCVSAPADAASGVLACGSNWSVRKCAWIPLPPSAAPSAASTAGGIGSKAEGLPGEVIGVLSSPESGPEETRCTRSWIPELATSRGSSPGTLKLCVRETMALLMTFSTAGSDPTGSVCSSRRPVGAA
jgi:hypothetical protein